jgi:hypothetical protein
VKRKEYLIEKDSVNLHSVNRKRKLNETYFVPPKDEVDAVFNETENMPTGDRTKSFLKIRISSIIGSIIINLEKLKKEKKQIEQNNEDLKKNYTLLEKRFKDQRNVALDAYAGYEKLKKDNDMLKRTLNEKEKQLNDEQFNNVRNREYIKTLENALMSVSGPNTIY